MDIPAVDQQIHAQTPANLKVPAPSVKEVVAKAPPEPSSLVDSESTHEASMHPRTEQLNQALRDAGATELKVELLDSGEGPVFHIVDKTTGQEILQIPSEYKLSIERAVEMIRGALFDSKI